MDNKKRNSSKDPMSLERGMTFIPRMKGGISSHVGNSEARETINQAKRGREMGKKLSARKGIAALVATLLFFAIQTASAGVVVVANPGLSVSSVTAAQVSDIFLGKMTKLADGTQLTVIEHQDGDPVKAEFYDKVVGKNPSQLKAYWAKIVFTGEGVPPKEYNGDMAVKAFVAQTPGAIGYLSDTAVDSSVKVIFETK